MSSSSPINPFLSAGRGSIGVTLAQYQNVLLITGCTAGGPADSSGVHAGDVLLQIDSISIGCRLLEAKALLAGPPGSTVKLTVQRGNSRHTFLVIRSILLSSSPHSSHRTSPINSRKSPVDSPISKFPNDTNFEIGSLVSRKKSDVDSEASSMSALEHERRVAETKINDLSSRVFSLVSLVSNRINFDSSSVGSCGVTGDKQNVIISDGRGAFSPFSSPALHREILISEKNDSNFWGEESGQLTDVTMNTSGRLDIDAASSVVSLPSNFQECEKSVSGSSTTSILSKSNGDSEKKESADENKEETSARDYFERELEKTVDRLLGENSRLREKIRNERTIFQNIVSKSHMQLDSIVHDLQNEQLLESFLLLDVGASSSERGDTSQENLSVRSQMHDLVTKLQVERQSREELEAKTLEDFHRINRLEREKADLEDRVKALSNDVGSRKEKVKALEDKIRFEHRQRIAAVKHSNQLQQQLEGLKAGERSEEQSDVQAQLEWQLRLNGSLQQQLELVKQAGLVQLAEAQSRFDVEKHGLQGEMKGLRLEVERQQEAMGAMEQQMGHLHGEISDMAEHLAKAEAKCEMLQVEASAMESRYKAEVESLTQDLESADHAHSVEMASLQSLLDKVKRDRAKLEVEVSKYSSEAPSRKIEVIELELQLSSLQEKMAAQRERAETERHNLLLHHRSDRRMLEENVNHFKAALERSQKECEGLKHAMGIAIGVGQSAMRKLSQAVGDTRAKLILAERDAMGGTASLRTQFSALDKGKTSPAEGANGEVKSESPQGRVEDAENYIEYLLSRVEAATVEANGWARKYTELLELSAREIELAQMERVRLRQLASNEFESGETGEMLDEVAFNLRARLADLSATDRKPPNFKGEHCLGERILERLHDDELVQNSSNPALPTIEETLENSVEDEDAVSETGGAGEAAGEEEARVKVSRHSEIKNERDILYSWCSQLLRMCEIASISSLNC